MPETLHDITNAVAAQARQRLGESLQKIILFGSYARGDFNAESDMDIMVLTERGDRKENQRRLDEIAAQVSLENDVTVSILLQDCDIFEQRAKMIPFYRNVATEGIELYAA